MPTLATLFVLALAQAPATTPPAGPPPIDPNLLPIGRSGTIEVTPGSIVDTRNGRTVGIEAIAEAVKDRPFLYLGEQHETYTHQRAQAAIIDLLAATRRPLMVGLEMITRPKQDVLDAWSAGKLEEPAFLEQVDWKNQWGFDWAAYRPVFQSARNANAPLIALNVPRDWVRTVGRGGYSALPLSARMQLPPDLGRPIADHRKVFEALIGGHPLQGTRGENMYSAQVLWDVGMADTALKARALSNFPANGLTIIIAGVGHMMYGQGINARVMARRGGRGIDVVMIESDTPVTVARGIGDFVWVTAPEPKPTPPARG